MATIAGWQSAYRRFHSTESAVIKVFNDLLMAVDRGQMSILCLLDLSAAFDTVDHDDLLLQRLERQFGLCGRVLQWIRSYLSGRTFCIVYGDMMSFIVCVMCSVPQGCPWSALLHSIHGRSSGPGCQIRRVSSRLC